MTYKQAIKKMCKDVRFLKYEKDFLWVATGHYMVKVRGGFIDDFSKFFGRDLTKETKTLQASYTGSGYLQEVENNPMEQILPKENQMEDFEFLVNTKLLERTGDKTYSIFHGEIAGFYIGFDDEYLEIIKALTSEDVCILAKSSTGVATFALSRGKAEIVALLMPVRLGENEYMVKPPTFIPDVSVPQKEEKAA